MTKWLRWFSLRAVGGSGERSNLHPSMTAIASISIIASGSASRLIWIVVLVGVAGPEVAHPHIRVLGELRVVGQVGIGLDDVGQSGAASFEAGRDVLADLLDLGPHIALADAHPVLLRVNWPATKIILPVPLTVTT